MSESIGVCTRHCVCELCVCMGVCVCVGGRGGGDNIREGKGRLKSWTLCDGLSNIREGDPYGSRAPAVACGAIKRRPACSPVGLAAYVAV